MIFALATLVLVGALGLVLDGGYDYAQRRQMQNAADAAAMAGASALLGNNATGFTVWSTVQTVAQKNGVSDVTNNVTCIYLDKTLTPLASPASCNDTPFSAGADVSAVQVTVHETHTTFVMRALGITSSSSGATATAQIQVVQSLPNSQIPFLPCGIGTPLVDSNGHTVSNAGPNGNGILSILLTQGTYTYLPGNANQTTYTATWQDSSGKAKIDDRAWSYSWPTYLPSPSNLPGMGNAALGAPNQYAFFIHDSSGSSGIQRCSVNGYAGWKGYNALLTGQVSVNGTLQMQGSQPYTGWSPAVSPDSNSPNSYATGKGGLVQAGTGNRSGPAAQVPGAAGCKPGQETNCVLILPIEDNAVGSGSGTNGVLAARAWAAFYMLGTSNGNSHWGYLIKNFPITAQGTAGWTVGSSDLASIHL
ncbi:MAG: pilus assembly protein TadG-related protein, partial [Thermomicrobiales bacterium]